jgi:hypothetical protein
MESNSTTPDSSPQAADSALNDIRLDEIAGLADLAANYWRSVALAADRRDVLTITVHVKQVTAVTRTALLVVAELQRGNLP